MKVYKVTFKDKEGERYWDGKPLIIVAADFANAEMKAVNFSGRNKDEIKVISLFADVTRSTDVFEQLER